MAVKPKILAFDVETSPLLVYTWGLGEQHLSLDNLHTDWTILSFAAKWVGKAGVIYQDRRNTPNEKPLLSCLWQLLNVADIVLTQNGKNFDSKKVNAKFIEYGMKPPAPYKHIDTLQISRKVFGFTSNKLAYTTDKLCSVKKSEHKKYPGLELWKECLSGNLDAWKEMEKYNKRDVLALEELYTKLAPWDSSIDRSSKHNACRVCDSFNLQARGYATTAAGKYRRYQCQDCGGWMRGAENEMTKEERTGKLRKI